MITIVFRLSTAVAVFLAGTFLFRLAAGRLSLRYPNIVSLTYYHLVVLQLLGSTLLFAGLATDNWWVNQANDVDQAVSRAFAATSLSFVLLPLLTYFVVRLIGGAPHECSVALYEGDVEYVNRNSDRLATPLLLLLLCGAIGGAYLVVTSVQTLPVSQLLIGVDAGALAVYRRQASILPFALRIVHNVVAGWLSPILTLVAFGYLRKSGRMRYVVIFVLFFSVTSLLLLYRLEKAPIVRFFAMIVLAGALYQGRLRWRTIVISLSIILFLLVGMYVVIMGAEGLSPALNFMVERIVFAQHAGTVLAFDYFPSQEPYLGGFSFVPFSSRFFGERLTESFALRLMRHYNPAAWTRGAAGYTATLFVAEAFASWGVVGILLGNVFVAVFLGIWFQLLSRMPRHPVSIALIAYLSLQVPAMVNSDVRFAIYCPELIVSSLVLMLLVFGLRGRVVLCVRHQKEMGILDIFLPGWQERSSLRKSSQ